jgi:MerR family mercuric resistance operon transcriptional regulator
MVVDGLSIGEVARRAAVHVETLRYYERRGLVARPARGRSNYRRYPPETVRRIRFVKRAQELGFSLKEIKELLSLKAAPQARCEDVRERAVAKMCDIETRIRSLRRMKRALTKLVAECEGQRPVSDCPILESLNTEETE